MEHLATELQTLYAELVDQLLAYEAGRSLGHAPGSFVTKQVKGQTYSYFQHSVPGDGTRQVYLGRLTPELQAVIDRFQRERATVTADRANTQRLCALLRAGGATVTDATSARVLAGLADAAVFRLGGVLVGTHAFIVMANVLGVRWQGTVWRTDDIDVATPRSLAVAVPELTDMPAALEALEMGFLPVPGLSPKEPATSFKVRGRPLRVDLLTPADGRSGGAVPIPRLKAAAQPLAFLDYLLEDPTPAAVVAGSGVLVQVPNPARFTLHKLIVAHSRIAAFQAKAAKDLQQAALLIEALEESRPGDLELAWEDALARGSAYREALAGGMRRLAARAPEAHARLVAAVGPDTSPT